MKPRGLIDTGAVLALVDSDDAWHERCVDAFPLLYLPLATTAAVLSELFHLLGRRTGEIAAVWRFLRCGAVTVLPIMDADLPEMERLMTLYRDRPMDFADATLVRLAQRESLSTIFTVDHDDFETYRLSSRRKFRILPPR